MSNFDPTDLAAADKREDQQALIVKLAREEEAADFKWLMSSKRGRRIIWRLLGRANVYASSFSTNAMQMAHAEGNRNEGLRAIAMINTHCPEIYQVMVKEHTNDRRSGND